MIIFPAASVLVLGYIALTLAAIGMMAWTGFIAFATAAVAALLLPVATIFGLIGLIAAARGLMHVVWPAGIVVDALTAQPLADGAGEDVNGVQDALDRWETDGGRAAFARPRSVRRHAHRGYLVHVRTRRNMGRSVAPRSEPPR
jgi:hypothetical protein